MKFFQDSKLLLILIIVIGIFFRIYKLEVFFPFGHDQDLIFWIAKDILEGHLRLIGQETSITGVFIGPLFYYLIAFVLAIFNMNPLSSTVVTNIISVATIISIYFVFRKFFGQMAGFLGASLFAISPGTVFLDRWVVPTQPTMLWTIWFLYVLLSALSGNFKILIPLAILIGLIWHIHIAFIPLLILLPIAFWLSGRKIADLKFDRRSQLSILIVVILLAPLFAFEIRHGFQQFKSITLATYQKADKLEGIERLTKIFDSGGRSMAGAFVLSGPATNLNTSIASALPFLLLLVIFYLWFNKILKREQAILFIGWFLIVFLGQFFSKRIITEYYFNNLFILLFLTVSLLLFRLNQLSKKIPIAFLFLLIYLLFATVWFINKPDDLGGYSYKKRVVEYIKKHSAENNYSCVAINFIEKPPAGSGYRYLYWYFKLNVITSGGNSAVYSIVNPWTLSKDEVKINFGNLGIIVPKEELIDPNNCTKANRQLLPLWGFNN